MNILRMKPLKIHHQRKPFWLAYLYHSILSKALKMAQRGKGPRNYCNEESPVAKNYGQEIGYNE